jgi:predicted DNA binding CopG/RHH family protein
MVITMAEKKKIYPNPKFKSFEEEDKYWATHGPLEEGYDVEVQKERQKHSSFLTIRLTGEELTQLRDLAMSKGMGPSTYIRTLIKDALTSREHAT